MAGNSDRWAARNRRRRRRRRERRPQPAAEKQRAWAELPREILTLIFRKVGGIDVLWPAQAVCRPWRQLALDHDFWRIIDMRGHSDSFNVIDMEKPTQIAVDRCGGRVEELYIEYFGTDDLLKYVADRSTGLRRLVLISAYEVYDDGLVEFVTRCPMLEELQITNCSFEPGVYRKVGRARPELKCFRLNDVYYARPSREEDVDDEDDVEDDDDDDMEDEDEDYTDNEADEIADSMQQLRELQLIGNQMTNKGLHAILEKCLQLESLDIRACFNVKVDAVLRGKLAKIKNVKLPCDSTAGYGFQTCQEEDMFGKEYYSGFSDLSLTCDDLFNYGTDFSYDDFTVADCFDDDYGYGTMFGAGLL